jgi:hypothetical protein
MSAQQIYKTGKVLTITDVSQGGAEQPDTRHSLLCFHDDIRKARSRHSRIGRVESVARLHHRDKALAYHLSHAPPRIALLQI